MKLSINLVHQGTYVKAGDPLPEGFELPSHLEAFIIDDPPQTSRATSHLVVEGQAAGSGLAKSAASYPEGEEEFTPAAKAPWRKRR